MNIIKPSSPMWSKPNERSKLETECLFGEKIQIVEIYKNRWVYGELLTDNYKGWIKKNDLGKLSFATHRIIANRSFYFEEKDIKSNCINYLPLGSQLHVKKITKKWAHIETIYNNHIKTVFVPSIHVVDINRKFVDWVMIAENLLNTPYKWGGRDSVGLDCSSLLQLSYQTYGQKIPRNSSDQFRLNKRIITNQTELKRGFVVFWKGHVGIMVDNTNCIHANAFHMRTVIEPLSEIIIRLGKKNEILKIMDFN